MHADGDGALRVAPLGGLGEIGLNCLIIEYGGHAIAVDCGLMFPDSSMLGVDLVIPDVEYLRQLGDRFLGFVITHGHEDHIGALPYVLRDLAVPVYATPMAAGLITARLREHRLDARVRIETFRPRQRWQMGPFAVDPIHVTHSIVDAVALAITTPIGVVVHSGDFKIDHTPIDGASPDMQTLAEYGSRGVLLFLSDSTNVEVTGTTPSERSVRGGLESVFVEAPGRVFLSTFSSHIHRLQQALDLSAATGRRVVMVGRSLVNSMRIAMDLGYVQAPLSLFAEVAELGSLPANRVTVLTSGSQGEALSALTRIAMNDHAQVRIEPGDAVILSSRRIPGNERTIDNMINHLYRRGAQVFHTRNAPVHVSGHASQDELATMLNLVKPRYFVPVHGEYRHLAHHVRLAHAVGLSSASTFLIENGQVLKIDAAGARADEPIPSGRVFVDGKGIGDVGDVVLRDRRHLSQDGLLLAVLAVDQKSGDLIAGPDFLSRGVFEEADAPRFFDVAREIVVATLNQIAPESRTDSLEVTEEVRKALRRYLGKTLDRRPVVLPFVMEM
ncbi:MAG: ribonuclease J [Acidobacteria bacterium RBG_16_68_9]|nr:MAG: ribonuclease J [Acidobacteria bacterium RBG_16_68_9]